MPRFQRRSCVCPCCTAYGILSTDSFHCSNGLPTAGRQYFSRMILPLGVGREDTSKTSHMQLRLPSDLIRQYGAFTTFVKNRACPNWSGNN